MLAAWLTEALMNQHGFAGCRDGFKLLNEFLEQFWDSVYPQVPDDGDLEIRLAPLVWCSIADRGGKLPLLLREAATHSKDWRHRLHLELLGIYFPPQTHRG